MRFALVTTGIPPVEFEKAVEAYLPAGYKVLDKFVGVDDGFEYLLIGGNDSHGWTLEDYVVPRLMSGNYTCSIVQGYMTTGDNEVRIGDYDG